MAFIVYIIVPIIVSIIVPIIVSIIVPFIVSIIVSIIVSPSPPRMHSHDTLFDTQEGEGAPGERGKLQGHADLQAVPASGQHR